MERFVAGFYSQQGHISKNNSLESGSESYKHTSGSGSGSSGDSAHSSGSGIWDQYNNTSANEIVDQVNFDPLDQNGLLRVSVVFSQC